MSLKPLWALLGVLLPAAPGWAGPPSSPPDGSARSPTLVIIATGSTGERKELQPALDALCGSFESDTRGFNDVILLSSDTDLTPILRELTPGDARAKKGALVRQLQGGIQASAFQSCRRHRAPVRLLEPLEVVLFGISYGQGDEANVSVSRYEINDQIHRIAQPINAHVRIFHDLEALGHCVSHRFWNNGWIDGVRCQQLHAGSDEAAVVVVSPEARLTHEPAAGSLGMRIDRPPARPMLPPMVPMIAAGAGVSLGLAGLLTYQSGRGQLQAIERDAAGGRPYNEANGSFATRGDVGIALMIAGGVTVATAIVLYLLDHRATGAGRGGPS
jgi:hypothetical protein